MARRAACLLLVLASAASQYSAEQQQEFEKTREALLARDPLAAQLREEHLHGRLPRKPGDLHHRWGRDSRSGSISRHTQHQFMWYVADTYGPKLPSKKPRCLDWEGSYLKTIFNATCAIKDYLLYSPTPSKQKSPRPVRRGVKFDMEYSVDAHAMASLIPHDNYDLVVANSVFEHMRQPFVVACRAAWKSQSVRVDGAWEGLIPTPLTRRVDRHAIAATRSRRVRAARRGVTRRKQIYLILKPGGYLLWHTPFMFPFHGVPADYFRYTHAGAAAVCEDAGMEVIEAAPDGGYAAVLGHVVGMDTRFFSDEEIHRVHELPHWKDLDNLHHKVSYHLSTKLVARKPPSN